MGGNVAARLAAGHPDRVSHLVTIGGVGLALFSPTPPEGIKLLVQFVEDPTRERLMAWMESMVYDTRILTEEFVEMRWRAAADPAALAEIKKMFNPRVLSAMRHSRAIAAEQVGVLSKIEAPTLITWGRDDRVTPLDSVLIPMRLIKRCEVHVFPDCGHWAMIERKDEFESVVLSFLLPRSLNGLRSCSGRDAGGSPRAVAGTTRRRDRDAARPVSCRSRRPSLERALPLDHHDPVGDPPLCVASFESIHVPATVEHQARRIGPAAARTASSSRREPRRRRCRRCVLVTYRW